MSRLTGGQRTVLVAATLPMIAAGVAGGDGGTGTAGGKGGDGIVRVTFFY